MAHNADEPGNRPRSVAGADHPQPVGNVNSFRGNSGRDSGKAAPGSTSGGDGKGSKQTSRASNNEGQERSEQGEPKDQYGQQRKSRRRRSKSKRKHNFAPKNGDQAALSVSQQGQMDQKVARSGQANPDNAPLRADDTLPDKRQEESKSSKKRRRRSGRRHAHSHQNARQDTGNNTGNITGKNKADIKDSCQEVSTRPEQDETASTGAANGRRQKDQQERDDARGDRSSSRRSRKNRGAKRRSDQQDRKHGQGNNAHRDLAGAPQPDDPRDNRDGGKSTGRQTRNQQGRNHQNRPVNRHPARARSGKTAYAALDLGTNNCRLLVAEPHGTSFRVVDAFSRIVRLGEGLSQSGRLSDDAQDRAIAALKVCQSKLSYRQVKRVRLIATEACRRAENGGVFLHRVYRETGLKLEIVNRETEARLAVAGCASLVHPEAEGVVLFDIGGGSSEIVWLDLDPMAEDTGPQPGEKRNRQTRRAMRHLSERIRCWTSLQVGVVTLSEKHGGRIVSRDQFDDMVCEVREMLHEFEEREALAEAIETKHIHMLGTSGTVTTLAGVHLGLERYDRRLVDGTWLTAHELRSMINRVLDMDFEERTNNPCIGQDRADLVLAGCAILEAFHREWPVSRLRVADRGLREGILMEMMIDDGVWSQHSGQQKANTSAQNSGKKRSGKSRRSRRRGGRGHRGQNTS